MENYQENKNEIGIDEAGRGPFFGPVYAAAVVWGNAEESELIKDSKKLSKKKRKEAVEWIKKNVKSYGIGYCTSQEIDNYGIVEATKMAMEKAVNKLDGNVLNKNTLLIDGIGWNDKNFNTKLKDYKIVSVVKGDSKYRNIAAASILAKEAHDHHINELCSDNEELNLRYDLMNNKGYGTKKHIEGIKKFGLSEHHRHSFNINY